MTKQITFDILARDRASQTFDKVGRSASGMGGTLGKVGKAGGLAAAAVGVSLAAGLKTSITKAMDFDKTMRVVGATLGTTGTQQKQLGALAMKMGADTVFSAAEAGDAMLELAKGGLTAAQIEGGALKATMTLAAAGTLEMGSAATYVGNALNTFGLKAKDADAVAAALAGGANASSASVESLGEALSQVGPGARTAGLSIQTTTGILAAFDNAGIKGSDAGTSLKTMLTRLVPTTKQARSAMADLGLKFTDASGKFLPMADVAQQLKDKMAGLSDQERTTAMSAIFGSDATRAATVMMNLGSEGVLKYTKATSDQAAAQKMANTQMAGASGAWEAFKGSIETIAITLGVALLPAFTKVVGGLNKIANVVLVSMGPAITRLSGWFKADLLPALRDAKDRIMPGLTMAMSILSGGVGKSTVSWKQIGDVLTQKVIPVVATIIRYYLPVWAAQIRVVIGVIKTLWTVGSRLASILTAVFRLIANTWLTVVGVIVNGAARAFGWMPGLGPKLRRAAGEFNAFRNSVNAALAGTRSNKRIYVSAPGASRAIQQLADLKWRINSIPRSVTIGVNNKLAQMPGFAGGVRNFGGGWAKVGEEGPEIVYLPKGADVFSNRESQAMVSAPRPLAMGAGGGSSQPLVVNFNLDGRMVQQVLLKVKRTNGGLELGLA